MDSDHECKEILEQHANKCFFCISIKDLPLCSNCRQEIKLKKNVCSQCMNNTINYNQFKIDYFSNSITDEKIFTELRKYSINIEKTNEESQREKEIPPECNQDGLTPNYSESKSLSIGCEMKKEGVLDESKTTEDKTRNNSSQNEINTRTFATNATDNAFPNENSSGEGKVEESEFTN